jgi:hypothetical protein
MRTTPLALLVVAGSALPAADAAAQTTAAVSVSPNRPNSATKLILDASGGSSAQGIPQAITTLAARGFRFDRRAVAQLCDPAQQANCPDASRIGTGTAEVRVDGPYPGALGSGMYQGNSTVFLAPASQAGDLAGLVVRLVVAGQTIVGRGRVTPVATGPYGIRIAFDPLPAAPPLPAGYAVTLQKLHAEIAARRTVSRNVTRKVRRRGRTVRRKVTRRIRYDLIRTPPRCTGSWPVQVLVRYPGREDVLDTPIACTSRR